MTLKDISPVLTLVLGILLGVVFMMLAFGATVTDDGHFNFTLATTGAPTGPSTTTTHETVTYITEGGETTTVQRADLRQVALPYLVAFPNFQTGCVTAGGTFHETRDWVGCEGAGTLNCNTADAIAARTQCIGVGADFICSATNIYCRYP
jgi:hypothetical protein